jgi:hypothetical protein
MRVFMGTALLFTAALATVYALRCLYVIFGYRKGNVATVTATLTNHSIRRNWYARQRWYDLKWTGYIYSYRVGGREYTLKGGVYANGDCLPRRVQIAFQCSDPRCSFIPELRGPAQMRSVVYSMISAAFCFAAAGVMLPG